MNKISRSILALLLLLSTSSSSFGQGKESMDELVTESKNDLLIVVSGGLAGAILGLSTLSFVEEPKEHTRNILVGASIGIIAGVGYVAFSQANKSRDMLYGPTSRKGLSPGREFGTYARAEWHLKEVEERSRVIMAPLSLGYSFKY